MKLLVTRPEPGAGDTAKTLRRLGHEVIVDPMLKVVFDPSVAIKSDRLKAIAVTSSNAVQALADRKDFSALKHLPIYCVGDRTASMARLVGFENAVSAGGDVDALVETIADRVSAKKGSVLYAAGRDRTGDLEGKLAGRGYKVRLAEVYKAQQRATLSAETVAALTAGTLDGVLVYSARTAAALVAAAERDHHLDRLREIAAYAISDKAARPLAAAGFKRVVVAQKPDGDGLLACLSASPSK